MKNGQTQYIKSKIRQTYLAYSEGLAFKGKPVNFKLTDRFGLPIPESELYKPHYRKNCVNYGNRLICNGCSDCGRCNDEIIESRIEMTTLDHLIDILYSERQRDAALEFLNYSEVNTANRQSNGNLPRL